MWTAPSAVRRSAKTPSAPKAKPRAHQAMTSAAVGSRSGSIRARKSLPAPETL